ncbi:hypothetical protein FKR81_31100 [Lentzea tibetensis]|uniref:Uncharacterized protein n=1 Tax=Lentzea tibetensis TaxID=2591470 RepID=A0A563EMG9_9PSEU|nr:DUF6609 family protein [Lentzea tibetensis]TWP47789.1 hypothetical protein FKR81_31100 [Lentzea tibetensis]
MTDLVMTFPLMRGGGMFLVAIGLGIVVGGIGPRSWLAPALAAGAALGVVIMAVGGATKLIFAGLGSPPLYQWIVLGVAFLVEGYLVYLVSDRNEFGTREFWMWMLIVVAAHFLILTFSHGPLCGVLAVACMINAVIGLRTSINFQVFWAIDGVLKVLIGASMIALTYVAVD